MWNEVWGTEKQRTESGYTRGVAEIGQNTEKSPGNLIRIAVARNPMKITKKNE